jgi:hypothetical protein
MTVIDTTATETGLVAVERPSSLVALAAPLEEIVAAQKSYQAVCTALLDDSDIQTIGKKEFKKRSAWNKLSVAFGVSTEEVRTTHERDERGRIIRTECVVRATAPNGRISDGIGACDLYERCCDADTCKQKTVWPDSGRPTGHAHCNAFPCKQAHFSNPQHDIPATAFTRASNRAKADLFGMGEVSAEEVSEHGPAPATSPEPPGPDAEAEEAMHQLGLLLKEIPTPGTVETIKSHLRGKFGDSQHMNLGQIRQAIAIVAGWPETAKPNDAPRDEEPF